MGNEARVAEGGCLCRAVRYRAEGPITPLTYRHAQFPDEIDVTTCSDAPETFAPADHTWTSERLAWLEVNEHLPAFAEGRDG